jgi:hypothetical protein
MTSLPPDLSRLGDALTQAAETRAAESRRRRHRAGRLGLTGAVAALALAIASPGVLGPADRGLFQLAAATTGAYVPAACDQPRGATFRAARPCGRPGTTDVSPSELSRRLAVR